MPKPKTQPVNIRIPTSLIEDLDAVVDEYDFYFKGAQGSITRSDMIRKVLMIALEERAYRHPETKWRITFRERILQKLHFNDFGFLSELFETRGAAEEKLKNFITSEEGWRIHGYGRRHFKVSALRPDVAGRTGDREHFDSDAEAQLTVPGDSRKWQDIEEFFTSLGLSPPERQLWCDGPLPTDGHPALNAYSAEQFHWGMSQMPRLIKDPAKMDEERALRVLAKAILQPD